MTTTQAEAILGLKGSYSPNDVKTRYRKLSKIAHPDQDGDEDLFSLIKEAYETLKDRSGVAAEVKETKQKPKTKGTGFKTPVSKRDKAIASQERIDFTIEELCRLASNQKIKRTLDYDGEKINVLFSLIDFRLNYYSNIYLVFDLGIRFDEIGYFSKETYTLTPRRLSIPATKTMLAEYKPTIKVQKGRKVHLYYDMFGKTIEDEAERTDTTEMTDLSFHINETEFGEIKITLLVFAQIERT